MVKLVLNGRVPYLLVMGIKLTLKAMRAKCSGYYSQHTQK
jgi:hypothetical protein